MSSIESKPLIVIYGSADLLPNELSADKRACGAVLPPMRTAQLGLPMGLKNGVTSGMRSPTKGRGSFAPTLSLLSANHDRASGNQEFHGQGWSSLVEDVVEGKC